MSPCRAVASVLWSFSSLRKGWYHNSPGGAHRASQRPFAARSNFTPAVNPEALPGRRIRNGGRSRPARRAATSETRSEARASAGACLVLAPPDRLRLSALPRAGRAPPPRTGYALTTPPNLRSAVPAIAPVRPNRALCVPLQTKTRPRPLADTARNGSCLPTRAARSTPSLLRHTTRTRRAIQKMAVRLR